MAKNTSRKVSIQLTPMVKFYIGVAGVVAVMVGIFVGALVPMFKREESLQRRFRSVMNEYKSMQETVGRDPEATIATKTATIEILRENQAHLASLFPESPRVPRRGDPQIFLVEEYHELKKAFFARMAEAGMVVNDNDYLSPPSGAVERDALDVAYQVHTLRSINALAHLALEANLERVGAFKVLEQRDRPWETSENLVPVPLEMTVICTFEQLMDFLYRLDHADTFFAVEGVSSSVLRADSDGLPVLQCLLKVQAPYLKQRHRSRTETDEESST